MDKFIAQLKDLGVSFLTNENNKYYFYGDLDLHGKSVKYLPDNLTVFGDVNLSYAKINNLPNNLIVVGNLNLRGSNISSLPNNLTVQNDLVLSRTFVKNIPDDLIVGGCLGLSFTPITELPDNFKVGTELVMYSSKITKLPSNLTVGRNLDLSETKITDLPDDLTVCHDIDLSDTPITKLPNNLTIAGSLFLYSSKISKLPENLTVQGTLELRKTNIIELPDNLYVGANIYADDKIDISQVNRFLSPEQEKKIKSLIKMPVFWERNGVRYIKAYYKFFVIDSYYNNMYRVHELEQEDKQFYLVTDDENNWGIGKTIAGAESDRIYHSCDKDISHYKDISLDDTLTFYEVMAVYYAITGACSVDIRDFIDKYFADIHKDIYTIREFIELIKNEYGGKKFAKFFK